MMKKGKQFVVVIQLTGGGAIIQHTNKSKEVEQWCNTYEQATHATELTVYARNGLGYEQIVSEHKRRIGF